MADRRFDVVIVGGGFTGSLLAYVLASRGVRVALFDAKPHPRFAVGESSTPLADLILHSIAERYSLDPLRPLCRYGSWKRERPHLTCGKKRGFSYFVHRPDQPFRDDAHHSRSLMVTASAADEVADTHWLRSDVDHYLYDLAATAGAECRVAKVISAERAGRGWSLRIDQDGPPAAVNVECDFLVDAGGRDGTLREALGVVDRSDRLKTRSRSTYAHFVDVGSWHEYLSAAGLPIDDHPFHCDDSAQHHLLDDGWLWMLRMDDGRTSVGWTRPERSSGPANGAPPNQNNGDQNDAGRGEDLRAFGLGRYPSLLQLFRSARPVAPAQHPVITGRLQRLASRVAGDDWALMPTAAVTIDPLHSGGIAHGLGGVEQLAAILLDSPGDRRRGDRLAAYERRVLAEASMLDTLVAGCYAAGTDFELFTAHAMFYFVAAIRCEENRLRDGASEEALWSADQPQLVRLAEESMRRIERLRGEGTLGATAVADHLSWTRDALAPWNTAGLMDPAANQMYHYTAAAKPQSSAQDG